MKELLTVVTRKGQITVPAEIRRALGLKQGDKIAFVVVGDQVRLVPTASIVERTAGAIKAKKPPASAEELREASERAIAEEVVERMSG